jgi:hypothetical protein
VRIRSVKPEFWYDELLVRQPRDCRLLYIAMWNEADDFGRLRGRPDYLHGVLFPCDPGDWFDKMLEILEKTRRIARYVVDDETYYVILKWSEHQKINHRSLPKLPSPPDSLITQGAVPDPSGSTTVELPEGSRNLARARGAGSREQGAGSREQGAGSPTPDSIPTGAADVGEGSLACAVASHWLSAVRGRRGSAVLRAADDDVAAALVHLRGMPEADWKRCIDGLVADDSKWVVDHGWSLRWIGQKIAAYLAPPVDLDPLKYFTGHENDPPDTPEVCSCGRRHGLGQVCPQQRRPA